MRAEGLMLRAFTSKLLTGLVEAGHLSARYRARRGSLRPAAHSQQGPPNVRQTGASRADLPMTLPAGPGTSIGLPKPNHRWARLRNSRDNNPRPTRLRCHTCRIGRKHSVPFAQRVEYGPWQQIYRATLRHPQMNRGSRCLPALCIPTRTPTASGSACRSLWRAMRHTVSPAPRSHRLLAVPYGLSHHRDRMRRHRCMTAARQKRPRTYSRQTARRL